MEFARMCAASKFRELTQQFRAFARGGVRKLNAKTDGPEGPTAAWYPMSPPTRYLVRITRRGPEAEAFGWHICHNDGSQVIQRSTKTFPTRIEALLDSVRVASSLAMVVMVDTAKDYVI
jgi:hypothetical protein